MEFKLKPITETSWILHNAGTRLAMIIADGKKLKAIGQLDKKEFDDLKELGKFLGGKVIIEEVEQELEPEASSVEGYPIKHAAAFDIVVEKYPSYAKVSKSTSRFAAGYYGVLFAHGWVFSYCPKVSTLEENNWIGPYRTKLEMQNAITQQKNAPRL